MLKLRAQVLAKNVKNHVKNHVKNNKFGYYMTAVAIGAVALQQLNVKNFTKFMIEKGIDPDEYYCPEELAERNQ